MVAVQEYLDRRILPQYAPRVTAVRFHDSEYVVTLAGELADDQNPVVTQ